jgi:hypothetical protein
MKVIASKPVVSLVKLEALGALANTVYREYMPWFSKLYNETIKFADGQGISFPNGRDGWSHSIKITSRIWRMAPSAEK